MVLDAMQVALGVVLVVLGVVLRQFSEQCWCVSLFSSEELQTTDPISRLVFHTLLKSGTTWGL